MGVGFIRDRLLSSASFTTTPGETVGGTWALTEFEYVETFADLSTITSRTILETFAMDGATAVTTLRFSNLDTGGLTILAVSADSVVVTPEPSSALLMGLGLLGLARRRRD